MTPEGQLCRDMLGELETQWERAGPLVKLQGQAIIPNLLMLVDTLCDRLDALETSLAVFLSVADRVAAGLGEEEMGKVRRLANELFSAMGASEVRRASAGQCDSLADLEVRHG